MFRRRSRARRVRDRVDAETSTGTELPALGSPTARPLYGRSSLEAPLRRTAISVLAVSCVVFTASDRGGAQSQGSTSNRTPIDIVLKAVREDLQSNRADI